MATVAVDIEGTGTGVAAVIQGTLDGTNWITLPYTTLSAQTLTNATFGGGAGNVYTVQIAGYSAVRLLVAAISGGTLTANIRASAGSFNTRQVALTAVNTAVNVSQINAVTPLMGNGVSGTGAQRVTIASDSTGQVKLAAGAALIGSASIDQTTPGTTNLVATELATGATPYSNTALSSTKQQVKASAGKLHGWMVYNPAAADTYIQVWDVASGSITVGTTAPTYTIQVPAGAAANVFFEKGITHATAINIAATTTPTGSTAPATAAVCSLFYV